MVNNYFKKRDNTLELLNYLSDITNDYENGEDDAIEVLNLELLEGWDEKEKEYIQLLALDGLLQTIYEIGKEDGEKDYIKKNTSEKNKDSATKIIFFPYMSYEFICNVPHYIEEIQLFLLRGSLAAERGKLFGKYGDGDFDIIEQRDYDIIPVVKDDSDGYEAMKKIKERFPPIPQEVLEIDPNFEYEMNNFYTESQLLRLINSVKELKEKKETEIREKKLKYLKRPHLARAIFKGVELYRSPNLNEEISDFISERRKKGEKPSLLKTYIENEVMLLINELKKTYPDIYKVMIERTKKDQKVSDILLDIIGE